MMSLPVALLILTALTAVRGAIWASRTAGLRTLGEVLDSVILAFALVFLVLRPFVVQSYYIPSGSMHPTLWEGDHILVDKCVYRFHPPRHGDVVVFRAPLAAASDEREFIKRVIGLPGDMIEVQEGYVTVGAPPFCHIFTRNEIRECLGERVRFDPLNDTPEEQSPLRLTTDALWLGQQRVEPAEFAKLAGRPGEPVAIHPGRVLRNGEMLMEGYVAEDAQYHMEPQIVPPGHLFVMGDNRNLSDDSHIWGPLPMSRIVGRADLVFWPIAHGKRITSCGLDSD